MTQVISERRSVFGRARVFACCVGEIDPKTTQISSTFGFKVTDIERRPVFLAPQGSGFTLARSVREGEAGTAGRCCNIEVLQY